MTTPQTFLVGQTQINFEGVRDLLKAMDADDFLQQLDQGDIKHGPICLCSLYAKLCYRSLVVGKNENISKVRGIEGNIKGTLDMGHGAVFEHVSLNFVTINCSRVFTHELMRHRVGTAFSQTLGRYCTPEAAEMVLPPEMPQTVQNVMRDHLHKTKIVMAEARKFMGIDDMKMSDRKKWTSALRRIMPSGANNEIGWTINIRSLRHLIELRTSRHAEWEIRHVFNDVANIIMERWPLMLHGAEVEEIDGMSEYTNLRV